MTNTSMKAVVDALMSQAQVFASAWALVGSRFDAGNCMDDAEDAKAELRKMIESSFGWKPIETIPQTLDKYPVAMTYVGAIRYLEGLHAYNEPTCINTHFYEYWYDLPSPPESATKVKK